MACSPFFLVLIATSNQSYSSRTEIRLFLLASKINKCRIISRCHSAGYKWYPLLYLMLLAHRSYYSRLSKPVAGTTRNCYRVLLALLISISWQHKRYSYCDWSRQIMVSIFCTCYFMCQINLLCKTFIKCRSTYVILV